MVLDRYRAEGTTLFTPAALALARVGITPNTLSIVSLIFAFTAAGFHWAANPAFAVALFAGAVFTGLNATFDALDGILARHQGTASRRGDYLDHVIDRYADLAILAGLTLSAFTDDRLGLLAIAGTFMTSYMGTQAQALGLGRDYGGILGRADRMALLVAMPVVEYLLVTYDVGVPVLFGIRVGALNLMLAYFALAGNVTAIQRFWRGWKALGEPDA